MQQIYNKTKSGFTLIELSIVLVIIGLITGAVLLGGDLINAAYIRAQISQIEKYQTAVRTFQGKYGYLPGDIPDPYASNFGFAARGTLPGEGDGNGVIESYSGKACGYWQGRGETAMFWVDLSTAGLIAGGFSAASSSNYPVSNVTEVSTPSLTAYFPQAKIGGGNYVYVWSGGWAAEGWPFCSNPDGVNYFAISPITPLDKILLANSTNM